MNVELEALLEGGKGEEGSVAEAASLKLDIQCIQIYMNIKRRKKDINRFIER